MKTYFLIPLLILVMSTSYGRIADIPESKLFYTTFRNDTSYVKTSPDELLKSYKDSITAILIADDTELESSDQKTIYLAGKDTLYTLNLKGESESIYLGNILHIQLFRNQLLVTCKDFQDYTFKILNLETKEWSNSIPLNTSHFHQALLLDGKLYLSYVAKNINDEEYMIIEKFKTIDMSKDLSFSYNYPSWQHITMSERNETDLYIFHSFSKKFFIISAEGKVIKDTTFPQVYEFKGKTENKAYMTNLDNTLYSINETNQQLSITPLTFKADIYAFETHTVLSLSKSLKDTLKIQINNYNKGLVIDSNITAFCSSIFIPNGLDELWNTEVNSSDILTLGQIKSLNSNVFSVYSLNGQRLVNEDSKEQIERKNLTKGIYIIIWKEGGVGQKRRLLVD